MNTDDLIKQARRIIDNYQLFAGPGPLAEATEFLRVYSGEKSAFFVHVNDINRGAPEEDIKKHVISVLERFISYVESGLLGGISIERKAQIDVVSDFLSQATILLDEREVHPAAPTVIIGAALEEFLRNWVEEIGLDLDGMKPCIDTYAKVLRMAEVITRQDMKDIVAWAGLRNDAAHGEWDKVNDRSKISLMLEGVNLFMRKYGERGT